MKIEQRQGTASIGLHVSKWSRGVMQLSSVHGKIERVRHDPHTATIRAPTGRSGRALKTAKFSLQMQDSETMRMDK